MNRAFKRALYVSGGAHAALLLLLIVNPSLSKSGPKGQIHYISLGLSSGGGGGNPGGGGRPGPAGEKTAVTETPLPRPSLRDLTTVEKLQTPVESSLRYPTAKPKRAPAKPKLDKNAVITKPDPNAKTGRTGADDAAADKTGGSGTGLTIGGGAPGFGEGSGLGGFGDQIGMGNFPYQYYLQNIQDRISTSWFQSLVDPGASGTYRVTVYFRIFRNGTISAIETKEPSGLKALDLSAVRAVTTAAPFAPLPADYDEAYLGIILIFEHSK
jgi:TonB family protein